MAFYQDDDEEQQDPNAQQGGVATSGESGVIGASGTGASGPQATTNTPDKASNFVGISQYLNANKPQAAKLGDQTAGVINNSADQARQGVGALNQEAQDKIKAVNPLADDIKGKLSSGAEALSAGERGTIKDTAAAQYKGPQNEMGLNSYQNAAKATKTATGNIDNSGTEQGRMNLIGQVNAKPRTQGMNTFDNALLQAGGGREKLAQAASANQDVKGALDQSAQNIRGQIGRLDDPSTPDVDESAGAMGTTAKAQADAYKQIQDAMGAWKTGFQPKVKSAQDALVAQQNAITGDLGDNPYDLTQESLDLYGLGEGTNIYNTDLNKYLSLANVGDINADNVASAEDYARYAALADLSGEQNLMLNPENASKAGTAPKMSINRDLLQSDLATTRADADARKTAVTQATAAEAQAKAQYTNLVNQMVNAMPDPTNGHVDQEAYRRFQELQRQVAAQEAAWRASQQDIVAKQAAYNQLNPDRKITKRK